MAAKKKISTPVEDLPKVRVKYEASNVNKRASKGKSILQFTLTITLIPGGTLEYRNCIMGIGKKGMWATPSLVKFRPFLWDKEFSDALIEEFQKQGLLDDLNPPDWKDDENHSITWER